MLGFALLVILLLVPGCANDTAVQTRPQDVVNFCYIYEPILTRGVRSDDNPQGDVSEDVQLQIDANNVVYDNLCRTP